MRKNNLEYIKSPREGFWKKKEEKHWKNLTTSYITGTWMKLTSLVGHLSSGYTLGAFFQMIDFPIFAPLKTCWIFFRLIKKILLEFFSDPLKCLRNFSPPLKFAKVTRLKVEKWPTPNKLKNYSHRFEEVLKGAQSGLPLSHR